ncbi:MAG TPA: hypothetical protein VGM80_00175 [Gaiellaceae bacterium]
MSDNSEHGLTTADLAGSSGTASEHDAGFDDSVSPPVSREPQRGSMTADPSVTPADRLATGDSTSSTAGSDRDGVAPLLPAADAERYSGDWKSVQGSFVDRPREAVEQADRLVADLMQQLAAEFSNTRANLEQQWEGADDASTEDLRLAMMRYRSFFERLLAA